MVVVLPVVLLLVGLLLGDHTIGEAPLTRNTGTYVYIYIYHLFSILYIYKHVYVYIYIRLKASMLFADL